MNIEERLKRLIDHSSYQNKQAASLAAKTLEQLREIAVPSEFTSHLEGALRVRIRQLNGQHWLALPPQQLP